MGSCKMVWKLRPKSFENVQVKTAAKAAIQ